MVEWAQRVSVSLLIHFQLPAVPNCYNGMHNGTEYESLVRKRAVRRGFTSHPA